MTGDEEDEIVQITENVTNIVRGKVSGTVMQFESFDGDLSFGDGIVIRERKAPDEQD